MKATTSPKSSMFLRPVFCVLLCSYLHDGSFFRSFICRVLYRETDVTLPFPSRFLRVIAREIWFHQRSMTSVTTSFACLPLHSWENELEHRLAIRAYAEWPLRSRQYWRRRQAKLHQKCDTLVRQWDPDSVQRLMKAERELLQYLKEGSYSICQNCYGLEMQVNPLNGTDLHAPRQPLFPNALCASGRSMSDLSGGRFHRNCADLPFPKFVYSVR